MSYSSEVLADSPAGYWRCQEASGLIQDSSGNANHANFVAGTPVYHAAGPISSDPPTYAITFDGTTEYFDIPDHATLDVGDVFTLECWANRNGGSSYRDIFDKGTNGYMLAISGGGPGDALTLVKQDTADIVASTISVTDNVWRHLVATKNGATSKLYIDGVDVTGTVTNATIVNTAVKLTIGSSYGATQFFPGTLAELAIYPTALSAARVLAHYNAATAISGPGDNPPIGVLGRGAGW